MKIAATIMALFCVLWVFFLIKAEIIRHYEYQKIESFWELADKSSTIPEKSKYITKFVEVLEKQELEGSYNALFLKTPTNSFDKNLAALKSLQERLIEIQTMDVRSFEYQTAIQQITGQEQGEANEMLGELQGAWMLKNYFLLWDWVGAIHYCIVLCFIIATGVTIGMAIEDL